MANSRFAYVRSFEGPPDVLLPHCWIVVRVDGKGFTKCVAAQQPPLSSRSAAAPPSRAHTSDGAGSPRRTGS